MSGLSDFFSPPAANISLPSYPIPGSVLAALDPILTEEAPVAA
jgi:hypothetical protein